MPLTARRLPSNWDGKQLSAKLPSSTKFWTSKMDLKPKNGGKAAAWVAKTTARTPVRIALPAMMLLDL
eukprot:9832923-Prorocentrum_lima.AAC.1